MEGKIQTVVCLMSALLIVGASIVAIGVVDGIDSIDVSESTGIGDDSTPLGDYEGGVNKSTATNPYTGIDASTSQLVRAGDGETFTMFLESGSHVHLESLTSDGEVEEFPDWISHVDSMFKDVYEGIASNPGIYSFEIKPNFATPAKTITIEIVGSVDEDSTDAGIYTSGVNISSRYTPYSGIYSEGSELVKAGNGESFTLYLKSGSAVHLDSLTSDGTIVSYPNWMEKTGLIGQSLEGVAPDSGTYSFEVRSNFAAPLIEITIIIVGDEDNGQSQFVDDSAMLNE